MEYAIATLPTPLLNTPCFSDVFRYPLPLDSQGLLRAVELVALPGTKFCIEQQQGQICKVSTIEYSGCELYADRRFLRLASSAFPEKKPVLPSFIEIMERLKSRLGLPYVWGGNWGKGIENMLDFYPPGKELDPLSYAMWTLKGVDCSGLLYEATDGATPRNTSQLVRFGRPVVIRGKDASDIISELKPLDLIVWSGHVIIVEDKNHVMESRHPFGVIRTSLVPRLREVMHDKDPVNDWDSTIGPRFVIRRWMHENC